MPHLPVSGGDRGTLSNEIEFMENITYLNRKTQMSHTEIMNLPYCLFLSYLKHNKIMDLQETEAGREYLSKCERLKVTTPDLSKLRQATGYKTKAGEN